MSNLIVRFFAAHPTISHLAKPVCAALAVMLLSGCSTLDFNYKRFTYDLLRQDDCRRNDIDTFCARTFVFEYDEYIQLRQAYLRESESGVKPDRVASPIGFGQSSTFLPARNNY